MTFPIHRPTRKKTRISTPSTCRASHFLKLLSRNVASGGLLFDSSALIKRYAKEIGTAWVISFFRSVSANRLYISRITAVEVISALTRRVNAKTLGPVAGPKAVWRFHRAFNGKFLKAEITAMLIERATLLAEKYGLRGYDAVQLAAALTANDARIDLGARALTLISADDALNAAASSEGLTVDNPNLHP
ncbi:MAG: type II toxin-antitoxin system VapC family toxin [Pyrinomonadaceae bacterium]